MHLRHRVLGAPRAFDAIRLRCFDRFAPAVLQTLRASGETSLLRLPSDQHLIPSSSQTTSTRTCLRESPTTAVSTLAPHSQFKLLHLCRYPNFMQQARPLTMAQTPPRATSREFFYRKKLVEKQILGISHPPGRNPRVDSFTNFSFRSWKNRRLPKFCQLSDENLTSTFEVSPFGRKIFWCVSWESKRLKEAGDLSSREFLGRKRISHRGSTLPRSFQEGGPQQRISFTSEPAEHLRLAGTEKPPGLNPSLTPNNPPYGRTDSHTPSPSQTLENELQSSQRTSSLSHSSQGAEAPATTFLPSPPQRTFPEPPSTGHTYNSTNHPSTSGPFHQPSSQPSMNRNTGSSLPSATPEIANPSASFSETHLKFQPSHKVVDWRTGTDSFQEASHTPQQQHWNSHQGSIPQNQIQEVMKPRVLTQPEFLLSTPSPNSPSSPTPATWPILLLKTQRERPQEPGPGEETHFQQGLKEGAPMEQRSEEWFTVRESRLTASSFSKALGFFGRDRWELWEEKIGLRERFPGNDATKWGHNMEPRAREHYQTISGNEVTSLPFQVYGVTKGDNSKNWLGASPDGLLSTDSLGRRESPGILEIKCPFNKGLPYQAKPHSAVPFYYIPQIQGLLEILDRDWLDLYSWTVGGSMIFRMERDEKLWESMFVTMEELWYTNVVPARKIVRELSGFGVGKNAAYIARFLKSNPILLQEAQRAVEKYRPEAKVVATESLRKACHGQALQSRILKQAGPI